MSIYTAFNFAGFTPDSNRFMLFHDTRIVLLAFAIFFFCRRNVIKTSLHNPIITLLVLNISFSMLFGLYTEPRVIFTILFMMYFLAVGSLYLSRLWALITIVTSAAGWFIVAYPQEEFLDYALAMIAVILTALMIIQNRITVHCKIIDLHQKDEETKENLARALAETKAEIAERQKAESKQTQLEKQLHQAQKLEAVGRFAGGMAHDINNMLAAISGTAEALLLEIKNSDTLRTDVCNILEACDRGKKLTANLLGFAQKGKYRREKIVDDEPLVRRSGTRVLSQMGHTVIEAGSGEEALQLYAANPSIELILLDLIMPGMDGDDVFRKLRTQTPYPKVILVSAYSKDTVRVDNLLEEGAIEFVQKPFTIKQMKRAIGRAMSTSIE